MNWKMILTRTFLMQPTLLTLMLICYIPGTVYGYIWYGDQLVDTWKDYAHWLIPFVPDSPTSSLFFTIALIWLWAQSRQTASPMLRAIRSFIEAMGVVTSIKYGVWACAIIFAAAAQGSAIVWEDWMLIVSHGSMALCALVYARFFRFGVIALALAAAWTFLNDLLDYGIGIYPYLPFVLKDDLLGVAWFTFILTAVSIACAAWARFAPRMNREASLVPDKRF
ncbi:DUF1405 domain-containing protein [Cohnella lubricantis]|uniref:DUF1405 domain-containing protein n=2 Tax=Cohnella lubricantis TaxID=2163172 RepID=A0A841TI86_9BACL|nr:DUF1405 domain-containing protein [Cohnella lubricantis]MBB6679599.1 DUF1405 domain-containing protein [Cohnella lubricantis]